MSEFDAFSREELIVSLLDSRSLILDLRSRLAALEADTKPPSKDPPTGGARVVPSFVKPNRAPRAKKVRKRRSDSFVRHREAPTRVVVHAVDDCPDCGRHLSGGSVHRSRQVIDIPAVQYTVTDHRIIGRYCGVCKKRHVASVDLSGVVLGRHRIGVRLMSLIGYLSEVCRMPKRTIQTYMKSMHGLHLAVGEITELLHTLARKGRMFYEQLLDAVRASPFVNADETGWREDGVNGYVWSFSNPVSRVYIRDKSRGHQVSEAALGEQFEGILVSDFYGGYNYHLGEHQRCWAHFVRDLKELREKHPRDRTVTSWVKRVLGLYYRARDFSSEIRAKRVRARFQFQNRLTALGEKYISQDVPQRILAQRCVKYASELFTFIEHVGVPSENNAAERAIRPLVIARKISGGTRSAKGSETKMVLASLFGTWKLRGLEPLGECTRILATE